jgi:ubiquinone/menaquinone biosynthesis C-methylase UbiE
MSDFVKNISTGPIQGAGFGSAAKDYANHRKGFPDATFDELQKLGVGELNQAVLDIGCGTGTLARGFARRGCHVTGADLDQRMLHEAARLAHDEQLEITWLQAPAENTELPTSSFDAVTAGQCWHWFDQVKTISECARLLKPNGKLAVCWFDWIPLKGTVPGITEELIESHNPDWKLGGIRARDDYYELFKSTFTQHALTVVGEFDFIDNTTYSRISWRKRIQASAGIVSLSSEKALAFDQELDQILLKEFGSSDLDTPHSVVSFVLAKQ